MGIKTDGNRTMREGWKAGDPLEDAHPWASRPVGQAMGKKGFEVANEIKRATPKLITTGRLNMRLAPPVQDTLNALTTVENVSATVIVERALADYAKKVNALPRHQELLALEEHSG